MLDIQGLMKRGISLMEKISFLGGLGTNGGRDQAVGSQRSPQQSMKFLCGVGVQYVRQRRLVLAGKRRIFEFPSFQLQDQLSRPDAVGLGPDVLNPFNLAQVWQNTVYKRGISAQQIRIEKLVGSRPVGLLGMGSRLVFFGRFCKKIARCVIFREQDTFFVRATVRFVWVKTQARDTFN